MPVFPDTQKCPIILKIFFTDTGEIDLQLALDSILISVWQNPKSERNQILNFFLLPNFSETDTTLFYTKTDTDTIKKWKSLETEMSHSDLE